MITSLSIIQGKNSIMVRIENNYNDGRVPLPWIKTADIEQIARSEGKAEGSTNRFDERYL